MLEFMKHRQQFVSRMVFFFFLAVFAAPLWAVEPTSARAWLDLMSHSLRELNYQGVFTYEYGSQMSSLRIFHAVRGGEEHERLIHLDGEPREIIRRGHELNCVHPGSNIVRLDHSIPSGPFSQDFGGGLPHLEKLYRIKLVDTARVAGRDAVIIKVNPKDAYRYGYVLYLDRSTGLLLKSVVMDEKGKPMERFQFSIIDIGGEIRDVDLHASQKVRHIAQHHGVTQQQNLHSGQKNNWRVAWAPSGYSIAHRDVRRSDMKASVGIESAMYTDGLSAFSVFLEPTQEASSASGVAQRGATIALTRPVLLNGDSFLVTVVGEVPSLTAERVASSVTVSD